MLLLSRNSTAMLLSATKILQQNKQNNWCFLSPCDTCVHNVVEPQHLAGCEPMTAKLQVILPTAGLLKYFLDKLEQQNDIPVQPYQNSFPIGESILFSELGWFSIPQKTQDISICYCWMERVYLKLSHYHTEYTAVRCRLVVLCCDAVLYFLEGKAL